MKVCKLCGEEFDPVDSRQKYCSRECARQAHIARTRQAYQDKIDTEQRSWAHAEANKLAQIDIDRLEEYIYNNYSKRKGTTYEAV